MTSTVAAVPSGLSLSGSAQRAAAPPIGHHGGQAVAADIAPQPRSSILFVHPSDEAYGADRILLSVVGAAVADGLRARVLLPDDTSPGWLTDRLREMGVPVNRGPLAPARRRYLTVRRLPAFIAMLVTGARFVRAEARDLNAGIVYVNTSALLTAALVGRPGGARLVWHVHELVTRPRILAWIFRCAPVLTADRVIAISDAVRHHITPAGLGKGKVVRIYNGVDPTTFGLPSTRRPDQPRVAFIGRLNRWKGYEFFLSAASRVAPEFPAARFQFYGSPPGGEEWRTGALAADVERLGMAARTDIAGFQHDLPSLLRAIDVVVVPSQWPEPFGLSLLEAMSAGCAVIAANHGAAPELVEDRLSGLLVSPHDVQALARALRSLLLDPELRQSLGARARERASAFSERSFVSEIQRVLLELDPAAANRVPADRSVG
jgi:glycosyltransferase involved in cell wall biosynthesis